MTQQLTRSEVPIEQTWNLEGLYPTITAWEEDLSRVDPLVARLGQYRGHVKTSSGNLLACLQLEDEINETLQRINWYAFNRMAEDSGDPERQGLNDRAVSASSRAKAAMSFLHAELLDLPASTWASFLAHAPTLALYQGYITDLVADQGHRLGEEAESVVALLGDLMQAPYLIWRNTTTADIKFDPVTDETGTVVPMALGSIGRFYQSPDRAVRVGAYESALKAYDAHKRTIAAAFAAAQKRDAILARLRKYPSSLAAALGAGHLPESLFHNLLRVAEAGSVHLRRYMAYRCRAMGLEQLMPYDMSVPLESTVNVDMTFPEAYATLTQALKPLGPEYQNMLERAYRERWCDWANNRGKANAVPYSSDCYSHHPVVLLHWQGTLDDLFVLAHEMGHALHSGFAQATQPFRTAHYTGFLAEMASTTNELLLAQYLLKTTEDQALRRYVLTRTIGSFQVNFFFSSMMAALQLEVHEMADQAKPLTYENITAINTSILKRFYGDTVMVTEDGLGCQWLRPPQHYHNFYSYQYATGIAAAAAFVDAILTEGAPAVERYLGFLRAGGSAHPMEILKAAGVDLTTAEPLERAVAIFADLVTELEGS